MTPVRFSAAARAEIEEASEVYEIQVPGLGPRFEAAVQATALEMEANPLRYTRTGRYGLRRHEVNGFPYGLVYEIRPAVIAVIAVAHHKRKPGYYNPRIRP